MTLTRRRLLHPRQGVGTRGAGAGEGGAAHSRGSAVVKGELRRGARMSAAGCQNPGEPSGEQASVSAGHSPAPLGHAGLVGASGVHSHCQRLKSEPCGHPTPALLPLPLCSKQLRSPPRCPARAGGHLHFGNSAVGRSLQRAVESHSRSRRLLSSNVQLPKLR